MLEKKDKSRQKKNARWTIYFKYYRQQGIYKFLRTNLLKLLLAMLLVVALAGVLKWLFPNMEQEAMFWLKQFKPFIVLLIFFCSESFLGLIPPDFFIVWTQQFHSPYKMVALLALLSYAGGIVSYLIGWYFGGRAGVEKWINRKFYQQLKDIKKWGGVLIIFAALFPLPFSPVCLIAGLVKFPRLAFLLTASSRFLRFFIYALVLFSLI
jgi:membrane protein YqaA with SNARE-associated domain